MDINVNSYIKKRPSPQKEILTALRKIILKTLPNAHEEIKMGVPWFEGKFYLACIHDHVNMGFCYNKMLSKYKKELEGKGQYMRHIKFFSEKDIDGNKLIKLIKAAHDGYQNSHTNQNPHAQ
jgi:hypothetical protein